MRWIVVVLCIGLTPVAVPAKDLAAGTMELSGWTALGYNSQTVDFGGGEQDYSSFSIDIGGSYYVVKNLAVGAFVNYLDESNSGDLGDSDSSTFVVGPQLTYNLGVAPQASVFFTGGLGYATNDEDGFATDGWAFTLGGGLRYFPVDRVSFDALLSYISASLEDDLGDTVDTSGFGIGVGLTVYFGG